VQYFKHFDICSPSSNSKFPRQTSLKIHQNPLSAGTPLRISTGEPMAFSGPLVGWGGNIHIV